MNDFVHEVEGIFNPEIKWAEAEGAKIVTWVKKEEKVAETELGQLGQKILSGAVDLGTKIAPTLLGSLATAWKNVITRAESGSLNADGIVQAVIQEAEVLGEDVVGAVNTMGSPELQALFALFKALGLHL